MDEPDQKVKLSELKQLLEKRDSIRVSMTSAGKFSYDVKRYYDFDKTDSDDVIRQIEDIYIELANRFRD